LNVIAGWWRLFRRKAFADGIAYVTHIATAQLNCHARPWI
jgi:hypothetical protein